jgi:hypothetical protein
MKITLQQHLDSVPQRWENQYPNCREKETQQLKALVPPLKKEDIESIIGNGSWTKLCCDICNKEKDELHCFIPYYYYHEYESSKINICLDCIKESLNG